VAFSKDPSALIDLVLDIIHEEERKNGVNGRIL